MKSLGECKSKKFRTPPSSPSGRSAGASSESSRYDWLDYLEGIAPVVPAVESAPGEEPAGERAMQWMADLLPGFVLALGVAFAGKLLSDLLGIHLMGLKKSPISSIMLAIVLGLLIRNTLAVPAAYPKSSGA